MFWEGESLLHIGWADCVKVARVRPATAGSGAQTDSKRSLQIVASFQMDYLIAVWSLALHAGRLELLTAFADVSLSVGLTGVPG